MDKIGGARTTVRLKLGKLIEYLAWLLTAMSFAMAWGVGIIIAGTISRMGFVRKIALENCKKDWAACCGGNQSNWLIMDLHNNRLSKDLKKKLNYLLDPNYVNSIWCSKWSAVTAKYIYWIIQDRGDWSLKEIMDFEKMFCIEMTGAALVAIMKKCEHKDK